MSSKSCIHCGAASDPASTGGYCVACGQQQAVTPSDHIERDTATNARRTACQALFGVAGLYLLLGAGWLVVLAWAQPSDIQASDPPLYRFVKFVVPVAALFAALGWAANYKPLAASAAGAVLYAGLMAYFIGTGQARGMGIAIMFMILAVLGWAVVLNAKGGRSAG